MTRAMDALVMTRARYRRRYGNDMPEASMPSRFLEEIPPRLMEDLTRGQRAGLGRVYGSRYFEPGRDDEWESAHALPLRRRGSASPRRARRTDGGWAGAGTWGERVRWTIWRNFSARVTGILGICRPQLEPRPTGATGFRSGQRVRHPKYGEGVVFRREGEGDDAKITVQFGEFGVKKLVEKFAQLEKV